MLITLHGRVEMDPMAVPQAASLAAWRDERFAQVLDQTVRADAEPEVEQERDAAADEAEPAETPTAPSTEPDRPRDEAPADASTSLDTAQATSSHGAQPSQQPEVTESLSRGESGRQETAGKGTDSPRPSSGSRPSAEPLLVAFVQHAARPQTPVVAGEAARGVGAVGGVRAGEAPARGIEGPATRANTVLRAPATVAGYRTNSAASAELLEHARDSVFKQVLMQLTEGGGEMRMRLEPPDLGELDLRLVVTAGNQLTLSVSAERADVAQLLQRHLDELKHTLQQAGLDVTGASIETRRDGGNRGHAHGGGHGGAAHDHDQPPPAELFGARTGGFVSADGLDFWA
jgi:flagellar hook-length control protein FliK